jgi:hypothetical protein
VPASMVSIRFCRLEVNAMSRMLVSDVAKADPAGGMFPPTDLILRAGE